MMLIKCPWEMTSKTSRRHFSCSELSAEEEAHDCARSQKDMRLALVPVIWGKQCRNW
jgi:hypothetical protein